MVNLTTFKSEKQLLTEKHALAYKLLMELCNKELVAEKDDIKNKIQLYKEEKRHLKRGHAQKALRVHIPADFVTVRAKLCYLKIKLQDFKREKKAIKKKSHNLRKRDKFLSEILPVW